MYQGIADAKKQWEKERERDTQQWISERSAYDLKISRINYELSKYKQKLDLAVSEMLMFQKQAEDSKLDYQTKMKTLTEKYKEEISDIMVKYDRQTREFEEKLAEMYKLSAASLVSTHGSVASLPQSFQESDLPGKLHILEKIMKEKDTNLREVTEIRYFLKEKEDQWKTRMETTVKQHEQALKQADEKHKCVLRESVCEYEHQNAELQKIIDEYNKFRSDIEMIQGESTCVGDTFSLRNKMKDGIVLLEEKYITEKATLGRKVKQIEEMKGDEIVNLCLCQAEDARKLKEIFDAALSTLKAEHHNVIRQLEQELSLQKSEVDKAHELAESLKEENECDKLVVEQLQKEVEWLKVSSSDEQIREQRDKWLLEARECFDTLIKEGIEDHIKMEEGKMRERLGKLNRAEERMRKQLEKMNEEGEKMREELEKMNEEEKKMRNKLDKIKKEEERMKKEQETIPDTQQWISERSAYELKISRINDELSECKQKLDLAVSETLMFQKQAKDSKLDYQTKMKTLTDEYKEISDIVVKYDRQTREFEEKLAEMCKQSAASQVNKHGSVASLPQSFQVSDLPGKLHILEKIMKEKDAKLRELEKIIQEQKEVILKKVSKNHNVVADSDGSFTDFECYHGDLSEASPEKLREHIKKLESVLYTTKQKCNRQVSELTQQHQKVYEISVRLRDEEFQAELRYFLKEKEDQWKTRMETTVKQHEQALKQADEKHKYVLRETICEYEHQSAELQKIIDEYNKFRSDKEMKQGESTCVGDTFSLRNKLKHEIVLLEEKYITEKATLERKVKQIEEAKGDEIVNLCLCQAEDARKLKETFDATLSSLKAKHHNVIRQLEQELSLQKSEVDKAHELAESLKEENEYDKLVVEQLQKEVERLKVSSSDKQIKEQRKKWFLETQECIDTLIKDGVEDHIKKKEGRMRERLEKLNGAEERMRKQLEKMNEEGEKMREELEKMNEEEKKMRNKLDKIKKEEERMKKEQETIPDTQQWISDRSAYELKISRINDELSECKQKLDLAVSETLMFQKQAKDSKLDYQTKMKTLTDEYKEEISDIVVKYDRQTREFEEKLAEMCKQSAASQVNKHGSVASLPQCFQVSDLPGKLHILEKIMKEKDAKLRELEKIILIKVSRNHDHVADSECYQTEADAKLKVPHSGPRNVTSPKSQVHHLSTGASIPAEELTHPSSASPLMQAPVIGTEEIDMLKVHAKADIRSVLSQNVPEGTITALEYSLDELSEHGESLVARASLESTRLQ